MERRIIKAAILALAVGACSCGGDDDDSATDARPPIDATETYVIANFEPPTPGAGCDWGAIPYPSDLFLGADGQLTLTSLPTGPSPDATAVEMLTEALHVMDGAGMNSQAYFPMSGDVDNDSLAGNVKFVDLENNLAEVAVDLLYRPVIGSIMAAPIRGTLLEEDHLYAAYVTTGVTDTNGKPVQPAEAFTEAIDLSTTPTDPAIAAAQENLRPLIEALDSSVVATLATATVFRTQHTSEDLVDMFNVVRPITPTLMGDLFVNGPQPDGDDGIDLPFGGPQDPDASVGMDEMNPRAQPHSHVAVVINGSIGIPSFRSTEPFDAGYMERDEHNIPIIKSTNPVQFTMTLPKDVASYENIPVLLWIHGINQTRSDLLGFTDEVSKRGYAYVGMDLLYHGDRRASAQDVLINMTMEECGRDEFNNPITPCDHIGDPSGLIPSTQLFHMSPSGGVPAYHPRAIMENLRQTAVDLVSMNNFLTSGDLTPIINELRARGVLAADQTLSFKGDDIGVLTESLGAMPAILLAAIDKRVGIAFLASPANSFPYPLLFHSASFAATFGAVIVRPWDVANRTTLADPINGARNEPIVMLWNSVIERGDAAAFARYLTTGELRGDDGIDLILTMKWGDEWVSNSTIEHLIGLMGLPVIQVSRAMEPPGDLFRFVPSLHEVPGPINGNTGGGAHTQVATAWYPTAHAVLRTLLAWDDYYPDMIPVPVGEAPFEEREDRWYFCNPIGYFHPFWGDFFAQHYAGEVPEVNDPFPEGPIPVSDTEPPCY